MATSGFAQRVLVPVSSFVEWAGDAASQSIRGPRNGLKSWMILDGVMILASALFVTLHGFHAGPAVGAKEFLRGTLIHSRSISILLTMICGFTFSVILTGRRFQLYTPTLSASFLHEQKLSLQACFISGLLLTGALYVVRGEDIPRSIILLTVGLATVVLSLRRLMCRILIYRRLERDEGTRNVLIAGTCAEAYALRNHLESIRHLGYRFKGFISLSNDDSGLAGPPSDVLGNLETMFVHARKHFVDEIFFTGPCERGILHGVLAQARAQAVDLRVVPDLYDGLAWNTPIEYVGQFPTIPLHRGRVPEVALMLKRALDIALAGLFLILFSPVLFLIAIAVKIDSNGPAFYYSERIGKKGRVFRCIKFRTMVLDAEKRRGEMMHMNERDGVLFKVSNDPRITGLGRILRKYSLDELPQFLNVLRGEMSIVGPRPPLGSEVQEYKLDHLRRLDVTPGITGLWQVQARQDPSFDSYISLDVAYIDNWSIWLDMKIILRTIGVVFSGTGS